jgi:MFS family permease
VTVATSEAGYGELLHVPHFTRLAASTILVRTAAAMWQLALVLFVLTRFGSPGLAGLAVFLGIAPGILVSPLAGALLDRYGRVKLMAFDFGVSCAVLLAIVVLSLTGALSLWLLLALVVVASITNPLGAAGSRTLFPLVVPSELWDRANAVDAMGYTLTTIVGPPIAGAIVAFAGAEAAIGATAAVYLASAVALIGIRIRSAPSQSAGVMNDARDGVMYVLRNRGLRGLALGISVGNLAQGILLVALPLLVFERIHGGASLVGILWGVVGAGGVVSGLIAGRLGSEGRERLFIIGGMLGVALGIGVLAFAASLVAVVAGALITGLFGGPMDIGLFSLRQRITDPAWYGRAFAVSMHLNYSGVPVGSAIAGLLLGLSITGALVTATVLALLGAAIVFALVPRSAAMAEAPAQ